MGVEVAGEGGVVGSVVVVVVVCTDVHALHSTGHMIRNKDADILEKGLDSLLDAQSFVVQPALHSNGSFLLLQVIAAFPLRIRAGVVAAGCTRLPCDGPHGPQKCGQYFDTRKSEASKQSTPFHPSHQGGSVFNPQRIGASVVKIGINVLGAVGLASQVSHNALHVCLKYSTNSPGGPFKEQRGCFRLSHKFASS